MMRRPSKQNSTENTQYYGYLADLLQKLSDAVGFTYSLHQVPDGNFGYRKPDGSWDGMIGELVTKVRLLNANKLCDLNLRFCFTI